MVACLMVGLHKLKSKICDALRISHFYSTSTISSHILYDLSHQLHVTDDGEPVSLYKLSRKWVHNDPELDGQTIPEVVSSGSTIGRLG